MRAPSYEPSRARHMPSRCRQARFWLSAGLNHTPGLAARSVELGAAKLRFGDDVIAAARFLGNKSLDATAAALAIDWQR